MGIPVESREDLRQIVRGLQSQGKRVVFTNGIFDLFHVGHVRSMIDARSRGDFLIVAVNSDAAARSLKGAGLPINPLKERIEVLCAMECVDYVTVLDDTTADDLLSYLRPSIHAKGTDYTLETVPERETVLEFGGEIAIVGDRKDHSTTSLLDRIGRYHARKAKVSTAKKKAKKKAKRKAKKKITKKKAAPKKKKKKKIAKSTAKKAVKKKSAPPKRVIKKKTGKSAKPKEMKAY
jgi:rfaE bifunctional protein nucleotidyltransferase chain/domain